MTSKQRKHTDTADIVIITGLSGSGMSSAVNAFEDLGFFCVDNMPLTLLPTFARLVRASDEERGRIDRAALVISFREGHFLTDFEKQLQVLRKQGLRVLVMFFEASDDILVRRFSETRRPHPADRAKGLADAIRNERKAMRPVRELADEVVDTSDHTVHSLRKLVLNRFTATGDAGLMQVEVLSFGHRFGTPRDMELLFDVRHLPNPFFIPELRALTGADRRVVKYLNTQPEVEETLSRFSDLLYYLLPQYQREGKSYVTVGIGCTGGRHRSVMVANQIMKRLRRAGFDARAIHRDIRKADNNYKRGAKVARSRKAGA
ncbi:MAG TPA: RNase adapter RapZ [Pyrinomonadaceae bacterium]|nr:RNase adapter RapZ [Pyrinomonadaceae bacterium]